MVDRCDLEKLSPSERLKGGKEVNVGGHKFRVSCGRGGLGDPRAECAKSQFTRNFDLKYFDPKHDSKLVYHCDKSGGTFTASLVIKS